MHPLSVSLRHSFCLGLPFSYNSRTCASRVFSPVCSGGLRSRYGSDLEVELRGGTRSGSSCLRVVKFCSSADVVVVGEARQEVSEDEKEERDAAHVPVLLKEVIDYFDGRRLLNCVDCTLGTRDHACAGLSAHSETETFSGFEVDPVPLAEAQPKLQKILKTRSSCSSSLNVHLTRTNFRSIKTALIELNPQLADGGVDGILMDLGMSSMQVNEGERGFGFMREGGVLGLLASCRQFGIGCFPPAMMGRHYGFRNIFRIDLQGSRISHCLRLSFKGNFPVTLVSAENLSHETGKEDFATFRPPPPGPAVTPEELLAEVPFHYWYSYADLPDNSSRKRKTRQKKVQEPKSSITTEPKDALDSFSLQPAGPWETPVKSIAQAGEPRRSLMREAKEVSDASGPPAEEPRMSLMRDIRKHSDLSNQKPEEPRRSLMRELRLTPGSRLNSGGRRSSLMTEVRVVPAGLSSPGRGKQIVEIDSTLQSGSMLQREVSSDTVQVQEMGFEEDKLVRQGPAECLEAINISVRDSSGNLEEEHKGTTSAGTTEGTDMEKEAFRLSKKEINLLVDKCNRSNRQINIGWRGWGHNYITLVHSYWKKSEVCKIKCKGAVTLDMDFLCNKLEIKTGGRVIHRNLGVVYLYRGRDYDPKFAPKLPVLHQRKKTPAKRLSIPFGLTKDDVNALRARGKELPALCKLAKNGVFVTLLGDIRKAFEKSDLVRVNCQGFEARNFRTLGLRLKKLVPCVLISYEFEHILMWRWEGFKTPSPEEAAILAEESFKDDEEDVDCSS